MQPFTEVVGALAWPTVLLTVVLLFRQPLRQCLYRLRGISIGSFTANMAELATTSIQDLVLSEFGHDTRPERQLPLIKIFDRMWRKLDADVLDAHVDDLARSYDIVRSSLKKNVGRTRELEVIATRMRLFAGFILARAERVDLPTLPGQRLAVAVALQVHPDLNRLDWLVNRFQNEHGFIGYHAALALRAAARSLTAKEEVLSAIQRAMSSLPNHNTARARSRVLREAEDEIDQRLRVPPSDNAGLAA